ncbi:MAG: metallophosphoesterase [Alphaproteobacteria bacterium]|nr:metallophosphoesterase [Alphaproteobacteria bacterium]MBU2142004.1 metallophosphoesterase [Alphaproteobacteria bacterium]MBU2198384.1 metallophosphoesterase [Alphaproteobacteria bacterium]
MRLLHVSDIHFTYPQCEGETDSDLIYRQHLIQHAQAQSATLGPVEGVLFTGDIAYCGRKEEFDAAKTWLAELCKAVGCDVDRVFVVPGNHDVNRGVYNAVLSVKNAAQAIASAGAPQKQEKALQAALQDDVAGAYLLQPIEAYNEFAAAYGCHITPKLPFWNRYLDLPHGVRLSLRGMTSTLISGFKVPENRRDLHLGVFQAQLHPAPGVLHLGMAHHPIEWMSDAEEMRRRLEGEPALLLFGHEHEQRVSLNMNGKALTVSAGAVNPERRELGWRPGYNFLEFSVDDCGETMAVTARIRQFEWGYEPNGFKPKIQGSGSDFIDHTFVVKSAPKTKNAASIFEPGGTNGADQDAVERDTGLGELDMAKSETGNIIYRFWKMPRSQRKAAMVSLGVLASDAPVVNEPEWSASRKVVRYLS